MWLQLPLCLSVLKNSSMVVDQRFMNLVYEMHFSSYEQIHEIAFCLAVKFTGESVTQKMNKLMQNYPDLKSLTYSSE